MVGKKNGAEVIFPGAEEDPILGDPEKAAAITDFLSKPVKHGETIAAMFQAAVEQGGIEGAYKLIFESKEFNRLVREALDAQAPDAEILKARMEKTDMRKAGKSVDN